MTKKNNPEDSWFEDFDDTEEGEEKPKKNKAKKKKKRSFILLWILAFIVILAILLFIRFRYSAQDAENEVPIEEAETIPEEIEEVHVQESEEAGYEEAGVYEAPKDVGPDVLDEDELPNVKEVIDTTKNPVLFSNIRCDYDYDAELLYISLRVYNVLNEDIKISPRGVSKGYNTYFMIRGIVDTDPGCNTELLRPGEWTECKRIGFDAPRYANIPGVNRISVQAPVKTEALLVECPEIPE